MVFLKVFMEIQIFFGFYRSQIKEQACVYDQLP